MLFLLVCCNQKISDSLERKIEYTIDFEQAAKTEKEFLISSVVDTIEYIVLETPRSLVIANIRLVVSFNEYLFVRSQGCIYQFLKNGQYVRQIGRQGQGPGEYIVAGNVFIDELNNEIVVCSDKLLFYSMEGDFLRSQVIQAMGGAFSDSVLWIGTYGSPGECCLAYSVTSIGDTMTCIPNGNFGKSSLNGRLKYLFSSKMTNEFYKNNGNLFFKGGINNDSIWQLSAHQVEPHVYINLGKYKLPFEYSMEYSYEINQREIYMNDYWYVPIVTEDDNFFYFRAEKWGYGESKYLIHDKKTNKGFCVKNGDEKGITDDILGGPPIHFFWASDDCYISVVEPVDLLDNLKLGNYNPTLAFKKQLPAFNQDSNQLIILCHKKK